MKNKLSVVVSLLILSVSVLPFLFGDTLSDRRVIIVHGIRQNLKAMEPMRDELIKMGIPKENIELIDLPENQGSIIENAQYLGNYIKDTLCN
jgi:triacylglycerol esterase/lipase EstA (alpha/beta hydrolase family)